MKLPRSTIGSVLAKIAIFAVALAALRSPSYLWANVSSTLALAAIVAAVVNVIYGRGTGRAYWLGFALCGGIYFGISSIPGLRDSICPRLVTEVALDLLYPYVSPPAATPITNWTVYTTTSPVGAAPIQTIPYPDWSATWAYTSSPPVITGPLVLTQVPAQVPASQWHAWTAPDRSIGVGYPIGTVMLSSSEAYRRIGHSMFALFAGVLGGAYARNRYRKSVSGQRLAD